MPGEDARIAEALADAVLLGMFYDFEPEAYPEGEAAFLAQTRRDCFEHVVTAENVARRVLAALRRPDAGRRALSDAQGRETSPDQATPTEARGG